MWDSQCNKKRVKKVVQITYIIKVFLVVKFLAFFHLTQDTNESRCFLPYKETKRHVKCRGVQRFSLRTKRFFFRKKAKKFSNDNLG